jgi:hypothetical protein
MNSAIVVVLKWWKAEGTAPGDTMGECDCGEVMRYE